MFNINLGKFLAQLRVENKLTQEQLAEMLNIDKRKISRWECGNSPPEFELLIKLSEIFKISLYELSICQKLKDEKLIEKTKKKLKTIKDLKKITIKKKIGLFLSIIFGIFLGLSAIYTIDNYNTVEIYKLVSDDENFYIEGNYIKAKNYNIFNIVKTKILNKDITNFNVKINSIKYEIRNVKYRLLLTSDDLLKNNKNETLLNIIDSTSFFKENIYYQIDKNDKLLFQIKYTTDKNENKDIEFPFKIVKKFQNNF